MAMVYRGKGVGGSISRRKFIKAGALTAGVLLSARWTKSYAAVSNSNLTKFIQPLRDVTAGAIPIAAKDTGWSGVDHYTLSVSKYADQLHPDQGATRLFGYGQGGNNKHLGGIIVASRDTPVQVTFINNLPTDHVLPVDTSIMGAEQGADRISPHLHGGFVPWASDGGPFAWWNADGSKYGDSYARDFMLGLNPGLPANAGEFYYPNQQGARFAWYHDHAIGTTRLNAYAGIASAYVITDAYEATLAAAPYYLPGPLDARTKYLVFQDKKFVSPRFLADNPLWSGSRNPGDLGYADYYDPDVYELPPGNPPPIPSVVPEFFGDTILVNGTVAPYLELEPRQYRLRMLNACNARFLSPRLYRAKGRRFPDSTEANLLRPGPFFVQIGTEAGFIPYPTVVANSGLNAKPLLIAPGERADLIVDLREMEAGTTLILYSNVDAPYPMGDPAYAYDGSAARGMTPDTQNLLQIRIKARSGAANASVRLPARLTPTDPPLVLQRPNVPTPIPAAVRVGSQSITVAVKRKTLNEGFDSYGRLIQMLGTDKLVNGDFSRAYEDAPTEVVQADSVEVWEIINLTGDTHPMHFHLTNVQVLSRQPFDDVSYALAGGGVPTYTGPAVAPDMNELGYKETVRCPPGFVTRVIQRFNLPQLPFAVPASTRRFDGTNTIPKANEYVWHCHILEHEEHDMMRPLIVTG